MVHSIIFGPIWFNSVLFSPFCPLKFYSVHLVLFSLRRSISVHSGHIDHIRSTLVLFYPLQSYSDYFGPIQFILSYSVHMGPIRSILSTLIHFSPYSKNGPTQSTLVLFGLLRSNLVLFGSFGSLWFILIHFNLFLCTYIMGKDMFGLKEPNLNPNLLKNIYINLKLVISKILSIEFIIAILLLSHINVTF